MTELMEGFPPPPALQVTLANWRRAPWNRWAFHHVRELVPSAEIPHDPGRVRALQPDPGDLAAFEIPGSAGPVGLPGFIEATDTDALVILKGDRVVFEHYARGMSVRTPHILMSVSKSVLGLLAGILIERGQLDPEAAVSAYVPEVEGSAWEGATVRHLLDMRAGVAFDEDYLATSGPIIEYRKATLWEPLDPGQPPLDLRSFLVALTERDGEHGRPWHYVSPNTDLLGWVIERAARRRYADLVAELLWQPMGAEAPAYITVDRLGAPRAAGGFCATARDLARLGLLVAENGSGVVPADWIEDLRQGGDREAWKASLGAVNYPGLAMHYRSQWYALEAGSTVLFGIGVYGQHLFIDHASGVVMAKFSSMALPVDRDRKMLTIRAFLAIRDLLSGGDR